MLISFHEEENNLISSVEIKTPLESSAWVYTDNRGSIRQFFEQNDLFSNFLTSLRRNI